VGKTIQVTSAQVNAARLWIERADREGTGVPDAIRKLAQAKPRDNRRITRHHRRRRNRSQPTRSRPRRHAVSARTLMWTRRRCPINTNRYFPTIVVGHDNGRTGPSALQVYADLVDHD
jgi:hypothetical protein